MICMPNSNLVMPQSYEIVPQRLRTMDWEQIASRFMVYHTLNSTKMCDGRQAKISLSDCFILKSTTRTLFKKYNTQKRK